MVVVVVVLVVVRGGAFLAGAAMGLVGNVTGIVNFNPKRGSPFCNFATFIVPFGAYLLLVLINHCEICSKAGRPLARSCPRGSKITKKGNV